MNKLKKHIWKIVLGLITFGFILILLGISLGAKHGIYWDRSGLHVVNNNEFRKTEFDLDNFKNIHLDIKYSNIEFVSSDKFGIDICYYDNEDTIDWSLDNDTLKIKNLEDAGMKFIISDFSYLSRGFKKSYVKIYLPSEIEMDNVVIKTNSSDINIANLYSKNLTVKNTHGKLNMENIKVSNMDINLKSGNFTCTEIHTNAMSLNSDYGNIGFENVTAKDLYVNGKSGNSLITNCTVENLNIKSEHGKITAKKLLSENSEITTNSGNVIIDGVFNGETYIYSKYGNIFLDVDREKDSYLCNFYSKYGKIILDNQKIKEETSYLTSNGKDVLKVNAHSGNINVNFSNI